MLGVDNRGPNQFAWFEVAFLTYQMNWMNSRNGYVMITEP